MKPDALGLVSELPPAILDAVPESERAGILETWRAFTNEQRAGVLLMGTEGALRFLREVSVTEWRLRTFRDLLRQSRREERADAYGEVRHAFYSLSLIRLPLALLLVVLVVIRQARQATAFALQTRAKLAVHAVRFRWRVYQGRRGLPRNDRHAGHQR